MSDNHNRAHTSWDAIKSLGTAVAFLAGILAALFAINTYVDSRIKAAINDPQYSQALAEQVRPALVVNRNGSILADIGGLSLIDSVVVLEDAPAESLYVDGSRSFQITVYPKSLLQLPPVIEPLDGIWAGVSYRRGVGLSWIAFIDMINAATYMEDQGEQRYRVEIVR